MSKQKTVVLKAPSGFQPGHPRYGGKKKRTAAEARALAADLGVDPMTYLLNLLAVDATEEIEFAADGTERRVNVPVTRELKINISQSLLNYFSPRLNSTHVQSDTPLALVTTIDLDAIMADPVLVEAAQTLSLAANHAPRELPALARIPSAFNSNPLPE